MTDQDRGAYSPQHDEPLAFDPRAAEAPGGPGPVTLVASAIVLLALIVVALVAYRHGMRAKNQAPELVGSPVGSTKSPPPSDAAPQDRAAGLQVYRSEAVPPSESAGQPSFAPPPEQPAPLPVAKVPPPPPRVQAPPAPVAPAPSAPVARTAPDATPAPGDEVAGAGVSAARPGPASGSHPAKVKPTSTGASPAAARVKPKPAATAVAAAKVKAPPAAPAPAVSAVSAGGKGAVAVQVGAFTSEALAARGWADAVRIGGGASKGKRIETTQKGGVTYYRAIVTGFATRSDAAGFCATLTAGHKPCMVR